MKNDLKVGQELWFVPSDSRHFPCIVVISKIGNKWAYVDKWNRDKIDVNTLVMDGRQYSSPGKCYLNPAEYETEKKIIAEWNLFKSQIEQYNIENMTVEKIQQTRTILGIS
jgi:hypothetical protein